MTTHKGNAGVVKIATDSVGELTKWSITETMGTAEDTAMGDSAATYLPDGIQRWTGSLSAWFDAADDAQTALVAGAVLAAEFYDDGTATGKNKFSGSIIVTSRQIGDVTNAAVVPVDIQFTGTGALVQAEVSGA